MTRQTFALFFFLSLVPAIGGLVGCREEPPPPEPPDLQSVRPKLDKTRKDIEEARAQLKAAKERIRAENEARAAKLDGGTQEPVGKQDQ